MEKSANSIIKEEKKYSLSTKVLKKWSQERLTVSQVNESTINASFIYDGTTCSNVGFPLKFEYSVTLSNASGCFTIIDLDCKPANGDFGYQKMCQYIKEGNELLKVVQDDKPLKGMSLDTLFDQQVSFDPSGCYCEQTSRDYKWNLVLQVLHYALNNN